MDRGLPLRLRRQQLQAPRQLRQGQRHHRQPQLQRRPLLPLQPPQLHPQPPPVLMSRTQPPPLPPTATPTPMQTCCQYVTSSGTGTIVPGIIDTGNHCDNCLTQIAFPFPVQFYNETFNQAYVSSNGNLQFAGNEPYLGTSCPLPNNCLNAVIFAYQTDLRTDGPNGGIFTWSLAPRRTGSSTLSGARLILAESAPPTSNFASMRTKPHSTSFTELLPITAPQKPAAYS